MSANNLFIIVLAAGTAQRFGSCKQLQLINGEAMVRRVVRVAEEVCGNQTVLVTGNRAIEVAAACKPLQGFLAINSDYVGGIGGSIACGVRSVANAADGAMILLADQPRISAQDLRELVAVWESHPGHIVTSAFAETIGPPIIFPRGDFAALEGLEGDQGARTIVDTAKGRLVMVPCETAAYDVDRPEDLAGSWCE